MRSTGVRIIGRLLTVPLLGLAGCMNLPFTHTASTAVQQRPPNVYSESSHLPSSLRRVAVMPLTVDGTDTTPLFGRDTLEPILIRELGKSARFELVHVTRTQLKDWTGQFNLVATQKLPPDVFAKIKESTGCDAVLFCHLTTYKPYPPLSIGWKLMLLDAEKQRIWWALDEVYDASEEPLAAGARRYAREHAPEWGGSGDELILASPRRFAQYSASLVVANLPER